MPGCMPGIAGLKMDWSYNWAMNKRLAGAIGAYAVLFALAFSLRHGKVLYAVLILFAGLALKTLIAAKAGW